MRSKLLDAEVIIKEKKIALVNTAMDISVSWKLDVHEDADSAAINVRIFELNGQFETQTKVDSTYSKTTIHKFRTDGSWKAQWTVQKFDMLKSKLYPMSATIDFDKKSVIVNF